ncbi:MAG: RimK family protein [Alphaproteobacteria bacterium]
MIWVIVEKLNDIGNLSDQVKIATIKDYISRPEMFEGPRVKIVNLARSFRYLGRGYYGSLLAEGRGHKAIPSVKTALELLNPPLYRLATPELEEELRDAIAKMKDKPENSLTIHLFFGIPDDPRFTEVGWEIFSRFRCPILKVQIDDRKGWGIRSLKQVAPNELSEPQREQFTSALEGYVLKRWTMPRAKRQPRFSLAVLWDPNEKMKPSSPRTLKILTDVGKTMGVEVELITKKEYPRLAEYDALFIRETTGLDHHTYRFAKKAEEEGMPVIDDTSSIMRCTNKVFLAELLKAKRIPMPRTLILNRENLGEVESQISYPIILKIPDGSFSRGIHKAENREELQRFSDELLRRSEVVLAQEFMYTEFDWRIGVLNGRPLFASQYFMSRNHWQVVKHHADGRYDEGHFRTMAIEDAPASVVNLGVRAARLMGNGLYGVDLKQTNDGVFVIEVNDNPNLDAGIEDRILGEELYREVIREFERRLEGRPSMGNGIASARSESQNLGAAGAVIPAGAAALWQR